MRLIRSYGLGCGQTMKLIMASTHVSLLTLKPPSMPRAPVFAAVGNQNLCVIAIAASIISSVLFLTIGPGSPSAEIRLTVQGRLPLVGWRNPDDRSVRPSSSPVSESLWPTGYSLEG